MPKYTVTWNKTYHASGSVEVEADSSENAEEIVRDRIGDYEGHMEYDADKDFVEAYALMDNNKWLNDVWTKIGDEVVQDG